MGFYGGMSRGSGYSYLKTIPGTECECQIHKNNCIGGMLSGKGEIMEAAGVGFTAEGKLEPSLKEQTGKCQV